MELAERRKRYQAIEDFRKRPLIVYATSTRLGIGGQMSGDAVREFMDQIDAVSVEKRVDILIHSTGGDALAAWKLMSMFREKFDEVAVLVPFMAFSAATLFALGADEIVMHPHASLGPIDPQVTITLPDGARRQFSYEDVGAFLRFLVDEVRITEQVHISAIVDRLFSTVDPLNVGAAKRASELSSSVGERLLLMHMKSSEDKARARQIAENLNKSFFAHGDAVSRSRARELNLKVALSNPTLEALLWEAYLGIEGYMELRKPFSALQHYLADPQASARLRPIAPLLLPPNAPPQLAQKVWETAAQQVLGGLGGTAVEVEYSVVNALIESTRTASEFRTKGRLSGQRAFSGEIQLTGTDTEGSWRRTDTPSSPTPNPSRGAASA